MIRGGGCGDGGGVGGLGTYFLPTTLPFPCCTSPRLAYGPLVWFAASTFWLQIPPPSPSARTLATALALVLRSRALTSDSVAFWVWSVQGQSNNALAVKPVFAAEPIPIPILYSLQHSLPNSKPTATLFYSLFFARSVVGNLLSHIYSYRERFFRPILTYRHYYYYYYLYFCYFVFWRARAAPIYSKKLLSLAVYAVVLPVYP